MEKAFAYLIGAGPGDPGLFTIKGAKCMAKADVVIYDYLANERLLEHASADAELIYVGKKGGNHTMSQEDISRLIVKKAQENKIVARLKGGDPFVFGRGGEEIEELVAAGVPFEVVPGITAAIAAPAYAGIPVTHRGETSTFALVTGHEDPTKENSSIDWAKLATGIGTIAFYMGVKRLPDNVRRLIENGRSPDTPVALVRWGTRADQEVIEGTLENIVEKVRAANFKAPAITLVGNVVKYRSTMRWFDNRPLFGKKVIVTRARAQASDFVDMLEDLGADVIEFPTIKIVAPDSWADLDAAIDRLDSYDWVCFTSINGVRFFIDRLKACGSDIRALKGIKICTIGPKTAEEIEKFGIAVDFLPEKYVAESVVDGMLARGDVRGSSILLPRAAEAREVLPVALQEFGAKVDVVTSYQTVMPEGRKGEIVELLKTGKVAVVTFTSSSTVRNFLQMVGDDRALLAQVVFASIGPITTKTAQDAGLEIAIEATTYTMPGLSTAIVDYYKQK